MLSCNCVTVLQPMIGTVGCARDITERKASEAFVQHLAHHDVLTDLPNRALLIDRLRQALAQARRDRGELAVLFIDLDRLKPVNDTFGHDVGDLLLQEVANRLRSVMTRAAKFQSSRSTTRPLRFLSRTLSTFLSNCFCCDRAISGNR